MPFFANGGVPLATNSDRSHFKYGDDASSSLENLFRVSSASPTVGPQVLERPHCASRSWKLWAGTVSGSLEVLQIPRGHEDMSKEPFPVVLPDLRSRIDRLSIELGPVLL